MESETAVSPEIINEFQRVLLPVIPHLVRRVIEGAVLGAVAGFEHALRTMEPCTVPVAAIAPFVHDPPSLIEDDGPDPSDPNAFIYQGQRVELEAAAAALGRALWPPGRSVSKDILEREIKKNIDPHGSPWLMRVPNARHKFNKAFREAKLPLEVNVHRGGFGIIRIKKKNAIEALKARTAENRR